MKLITFLTATAALSAASAASAETYAYKGKGTTTVVTTSVDQADGSKAQLYQATLVAWNISGYKAGETFGGHCTGLGIITPEQAYYGTLRCTYDLSPEDGFVVDLVDDEKGGTSKVVGGKGIFKNATGSGSYTYTWGDTINGEKLTWDHEITLETP